MHSNDFGDRHVWPTSVAYLFACGRCYRRLYLVVNTARAIRSLCSFDRLGIMVRAWYLQSVADDGAVERPPDKEKLLKRETVATKTGVRVYYVSVNVFTCVRYYRGLRSN